MADLNFEADLTDNTIVNLILLFTLLYHSIAWSDDCVLRPKSFDGAIQALNRTLTSASQQSVECAEQEIVDTLLDPIWLQDFAMKQCEAKPTCKATLVKEAARVSKLAESRFFKLNAIALWGEIQRFSGVNRIAPIQLSDLPLDEDPVALFEKLRAEKIANREVNKNENVALACTALAALIGPGKFKAVSAVGKVVSVSNVIQRAHDVEKVLKNNKLPALVKEKFLKWEKEVQEKGIAEVRKIPGFHDEPVGTGGRSVRLNDHFRACYESIIENGVTIIKIFAISSDHKNYCR